MVRSLLHRWIHRLFTAEARPSSPGRRKRSCIRPTLEELEARLTPSVTFAPALTFAAGNYPSSLAIADINGDGRPDLVFANINNDTVSVMLNTTPPGATAPSFAAPVTFATGVQPTSVAVGDFNGDGKLDIAVTNYNGSSTIGVFLNTTPVGASTPSFAPMVTFAVGGQPGALVAADFNGDNKPDLAFTTASFGNTVSVMLNQTTTSLAFAAPVTFAVGNGPESIAVGDFNGDHKPDLVTVNNGDGTISVLLDMTATGASVPSFAPAPTFAVGGNPIFVAVGDLNGDGRPDVAVANNGDQTVSVLLDTTATGATVPSFTASRAFAAGGQPTSVAIGDFNSDGRPDIAVVNQFTSTVAVLLNAGAVGATVPAFAPPQTLAVGGGPRYLLAQDLNGDGRPDLIVTTSSAISVLLDTTAVLAGQFGTQGVWEFNQVSNAWSLLTAANASLLAVDVNGDVAGEFPGYGLWVYRPFTGAWTQLNPVDVTALAIDALGDVVANFPGYGVGEFSPSGGGRTLTPANAALLAVDAGGDVFADFRGYGVQEYRPATNTWVLLNGTEATLLSVNPVGELLVNFSGYGVATYTAGFGWNTLTTRQAQALAIDPEGNVTGSFAGTGGGPPGSNSFPGVGTGLYRPASGWTALTPVVASQLGQSAAGDVFAEFTGYGVWEFDPFRGWTQLPLPGADATLLAVA